MLAAISAGEIQGIVCWHTDRLYRRLRDLLPLIDLCNDWGVSIETVRGGRIDLSTPQGRTTAKLMATISEGEMEQKSDRHRRALRQRADQGRAWWPSRPFGYADNTGAQLHNDEAALIRDAYKQILAGGALYSIAKCWNDAGVATPQGNRWRGVTVRPLLLKVRNAGLREYKGEIVGPGTWPAIVDENIYRATVAVLTAKDRALTTTARKHLLSGLAICDKCKRPLTSGIITHTKRPKYECEEPGCAKVSRTAEPIDAFVLRVIANKLSEPEAAKLLIDDGCENIAQLQLQAEALRKRISVAEDDYKQGFINARLLKETTDHINDELVSVEAKMLDADRARIFDGVPLGSADADAALRTSPLERQRVIIRALVKVTILPGVRGVRAFDPKTVRIEPA
jgi:hypothetical protein